MPSANDLRGEEIAALLAEIRQRVRARYPGESVKLESGGPEPISVPLPDLLPVVHARDAAQAKMAAIGSVNPRPGGALNNILQRGKRAIARGMAWFVRDQITFNREMVACVEALLEAMNDQNRALHTVALQFNQRVRDLNAAAQQSTAEWSAVRAEAEQLKDIRLHWQSWRAEWERNLARNEISFLRSIADLQIGFQHRATLMETNFRENLRGQHNDYLGALDRANLDIQRRLWADLDNTRREFERLIHAELRMIRQRSPVASAAPAPSALSQQPDAGAAFDSAWFAERFRGPAASVQQRQEFYLPYLRDQAGVLDIGCGRGEFLELMRANGIAARGIELSSEYVSLCRSKGLAVEQADLFPYLETLPDASENAIFSSQVVEHLPPLRLPEMIRLCGAKMQRGSLLAVETPNPECLAIFATHFYLDPTHAKPVPSPLLRFYMEEAGFGDITVIPLAPAVESFPEIAELPQAFRERFFGGLDYAILGWKL